MILQKEIDDKKKEKPRINMDHMITDPNERDRDDPVGRKQRRGQPIRGRSLIEGTINKGRSRHEIDEEEAKLEKKLQPEIDALDEEIKQLQKILNRKEGVNGLIPWLQREIDRFCP